MKNITGSQIETLQAILELLQDSEKFPNNKPLTDHFAKTLTDIMNNSKPDLLDSKSNTLTLVNAKCKRNLISSVSPYGSTQNIVVFTSERSGEDYYWIANEGETKKYEEGKSYNIKAYLYTDSTDRLLWVKDLTQSEVLNAQAAISEQDRITKSRSKPDALDVLLGKARYTIDN